MKKIFRKIFAFLLVLIILIINDKSGLARTKSKNKVLFLRIDMSVSPQRNFIRGWISVKLAPEKIYQFNIKNLILEKVKLGKTQIKSPFITKEGFLRIITTRKKRWLSIQYKLHVNFIGSPFNYIKIFFQFQMHLLSLK